MYRDILNSFLGVKITLLKEIIVLKLNFRRETNKNLLHIETLKVHSSLSKHLFIYYNVGPLMLLGSKLTSKYLVTSQCHLRATQYSAFSWPNFSPFDFWHSLLLLVSSCFIILKDLIEISHQSLSTHCPFYLHIIEHIC